MAWRQADRFARRRVDGLFESHLKTHLIATSDQSHPRGRAIPLIRVALRKPQAFNRQTVHVRRGVVALAIAAHISIAEVVRQDEDDVRLSVLREAGAAETCERQ